VKRMIFVVLLSLFPALAFSGPLPNPIIFVKQTKVNHSGTSIQDLTGNFLGSNPAKDQPVGGGLYLLDASGELRELVGGPSIAVRDPEVSLDGRNVIFSMKEGAKGNWQIWEYDLKANFLKRFSTDPSVNDFDPAYLPYEKVVFVSDRLRLADPYRNYPSAQMYITQEDGTEAQLLNANPGGHSNPSRSFVLQPDSA
jgi:Tol biopolymer transport system component